MEVRYRHRVHRNIETKRVFCSSSKKIVNSVVKFVSLKTGVGDFVKEPDKQAEIPNALYDIVFRPDKWKSSPANSIGDIGHSGVNSLSHS